MLVLSFVTLAIASQAIAFPAYGSLGGLSEEELARIIPTLEIRSPTPPPGPLNDTTPKLVNDKKHPWKPAGRNDIRGPCPGLNTLASHGWLPRNGVATPEQIINAVQEGFNMENSLAVFLTYAAFLVDGNLLTNLLSIGGKTARTGPDPPSPAIVGGLNTHGVFEGDASMTRGTYGIFKCEKNANIWGQGDAFFGDNHSFNETLFQQFIDYSNRFGAGNYNMTVAAELRFKRIQDSIATNPNFSFVSPRYFTAYAESTFPIAFFVDGRKDDGQLDLKTARTFFQEGRFPDGFFRANGPHDGSGTSDLFAAHPVMPGENHGVNNYTLVPTSADFSTFCKLYEDFVNVTVRSLYPNPKGVLLRALNQNLDFFYSGIVEPGCAQIFPYGQ